MRVSVKRALTVVSMKKIFVSAEVDDVTIVFQRTFYFFFGADNSTELIPLNSISEHRDSGRASPQGIC